MRRPLPLQPCTDMPWSQVDFDLVRYSPIEGTHYFWDLQFPTSMQFLLSGAWESWDVGYVRRKAQDPTVRRIAEQAEAYVIGIRVPGYHPWPSEPPSDLHVAHPSPRTSVASSLPSPSVDGYFSPAPHAQPYGQHPSQSTPLASPQYGHFRGPGQGEPSSANSHNSALPSEQAASSETPVAHDPGFWNETSAAQSSGAAHGRVPQVDTVSTYLPQPTMASPVLPPANRETKILLSLDGDGVRGLSQVLLVESLVNAVCAKIGSQIEPYRIFDMIGGCSMGGVFGLMLNRLRMQAPRAREAYKVIAKEVFANKRDFFYPNASPPTDDSDPVGKAVTSLVTRELGDSEERLQDTSKSASYVFVIATKIETGMNKAALMRSFQTRRVIGAEIDDNITIRNAMRSTCIAPGYLQRAEGVAGTCTVKTGIADYGTLKNNPVRDIFYECRSVYEYAAETMVVISIGSGQGFDSDREIPEMARIVQERSTEGGVAGEKFEADHTAFIESGCMRYFRFDVPDLHDIPLEEWCHEEKIREKTLAYLRRPEVGAMFYACADAITAVLVDGRHR